jgi:hypothetical protein
MNSEIMNLAEMRDDACIQGLHLGAVWFGGCDSEFQRMRISLTIWLGIANFSVWLDKTDVVGDNQCFVCFVRCG